jgi:hypothetical protein
MPGGYLVLLLIRMLAAGREELRSKERLHPRRQYASLKRKRRGVGADTLFEGPAHPGYLNFAAKVKWKESS